MVDQLQFHDPVASGTEERVAAKVLEEELLKWFTWKDAEAIGIGRYIIREDLGELSSDILITDIAMQAVIANALEALWEDVLNHPADKTKDREGGIFDLSGTMVSVPVPNSFSVIALNASDRDGR